MIYIIANHYICVFMDYTIKTQSCQGQTGENVFDWCNIIILHKTQSYLKMDIVNITAIFANFEVSDFILKRVDELQILYVA